MFAITPRRLHVDLGPLDHVGEVAVFGDRNDLRAWKPVPRALKALLVNRIYFRQRRYSGVVFGQRHDPTARFQENAESVANDAFFVALVTPRRPDHVDHVAKGFLGLLQRHLWIVKVKPNPIGKEKMITTAVAVPKNGLAPREAPHVF